MNGETVTEKQMKRNQNKYTNTPVRGERNVNLLKNEYNNVISFFFVLNTSFISETRILHESTP